MLRKLRSKLIFQGLVAMDTIWFELKYHKSSHGNCFQSKIVVSWRFTYSKATVRMAVISLFSVHILEIMRLEQCFNKG